MKGEGKKGNSQIIHALLQDDFFFILFFKLQTLPPVTKNLIATHKQIRFFSTGE
jgi:hypothetical protein